MSRVISIVVPIYNGEKYIHKCVKSILNQDYSHFEVILVNDGSRDNSLEICKGLEKQDSRIRVISQENQGPVMARRNGVLNAKGDNVTFLDVDDKFCDKKVLSKLIKTLEETRADVIQFGNYHTYFYGLIKRKKTKEPLELDRIGFEQNVYMDLFGGEPKCLTPTVWGKVYPTNKLKDVFYDINIRINMGDDLYINNLYFERYKPDKFIVLDYAGISHGIGIGISVGAANRTWLDYVQLKELQREIIKRNSLPDKFLYHTYVELLYLLFYSAVHIYEASDSYEELHNFITNAFKLNVVRNGKEYLMQTKYERWEMIDEFCYLTASEYCATVINYVKNYTIKDKIKKIVRKILYR